MFKMTNYIKINRNENNLMQHTKTINSILQQYKTHTCIEINNKTLVHKNHHSVIEI